MRRKQKAAPTSTRACATSPPSTRCAPPPRPTEGPRARPSCPRRARYLLLASRWPRSAPPVSPFHLRAPTPRPLTPAPRRRRTRPGCVTSPRWASPTPSSTPSCSSRTAARSKTRCATSWESCAPRCEAAEGGRAAPCASPRRRAIALDRAEDGGREVRFDVSAPGEACARQASS